jgi:hypothetical protein
MRNLKLGESVVLSAIKFTDVHDATHKNPVNLKMDKGNAFIFPLYVERKDTVEQAKNYLMDKPWKEFYANFSTMTPYQEKDAKSKMKRLLAILYGTPFKAHGVFEPVINVDGSINEDEYAVLIVRK